MKEPRLEPEIAVFLHFLSFEENELLKLLDFLKHCDSQCDSACFNDG